MIEFIGLMIGGIIFGALAGPAISFSLSIGIYKIRERGMDSKIKSMNAEHQSYINSIMRQHQRYQKKYSKMQDKIIRLVDQKTQGQ